ncbi:MAG: putative quinol monooxygenase [Halobacteriales archaeon]|nr:putative quinol monooxygenase [Halobacteriales archaeon]
MIVVHATVPVDPEKHDEAIESAKSVAEKSRDEDGIVEYRVAVDADDENLLRFFEQYEDEAAFGAHASSDHFAEFVATLPEFLNGEANLKRFEVSEATEMNL